MRRGWLSLSARRDRGTPRQRQTRATVAHCTAVASEPERCARLAGCRSPRVGRSRRRPAATDTHHQRRPARLQRRRAAARQPASHTHVFERSPSSVLRSSSPPSLMELHHQPRRPASPSDALRRCGRWAPSTAVTRPRIRRASRRGDDAHTCNNATLPSVRPPIEKKAPRSGANRARVRHAEPRGGGSGGFADAAERGAERTLEPANNCYGWSDAGHATESGLALPASLRGRASLMLCSAARSASADVRQLALMRG